MQLELSIESLLNKEKIESNRIEFKEGWNSDDIYRSICAFANDFDSQGGGYILIGVEEKNGVAVRPVLGVEENTIDALHKDMVGNPHAKLEDISEILLTEHLKATGSKLANQVRIRGVGEVLDEMQLLSGPPEMHRIRNVALMMFCEDPGKFFPYMQVDIVKFPEGSIRNPNSFIEVPSIKGSVPQIIRRTCEKIQDLAIENIVDKIPNQMESVTSTSYPYNAIEEVVVNAFYHRDYTKHEPVTIEIEPECIRVINCPGIDRSVPDAAIKEGKRFRSRYYRNRRLGEFLHELELCEGHCTGIPTIQEELEKNGSELKILPFWIK